jgi:hypothetical protein
MAFLVPTCLIGEYCTRNYKELQVTVNSGAPGDDFKLLHSSNELWHDK